MKALLIEAQDWLALCQQGIKIGLPYADIPFDNFLAAMSKCLPCQVQINDNPVLTVEAIGMIQQTSFMLSYRSAPSASGDNYLGGGIALDAARIIIPEPE